MLDLEADPRATVARGRAIVDVVARPASGPERAEVLARAHDIYVGYRTLLRQGTGRHVRVFVLDPPAMR